MDEQRKSMVTRKALPRAVSKKPPARLAGAETTKSIVKPAMVRSHVVQVWFDAVMYGPEIDMQSQTLAAGQLFGKKYESPEWTCI